MGAGATGQLQMTERPGCCRGSRAAAAAPSAWPAGTFALKAAGWCWSWWTNVTWQKAVSCRQDTQGASVVTHVAQQLASRTLHSPATSSFSMNSEKTAAAPVMFPVNTRKAVGHGSLTAVDLRRTGSGNTQRCLQAGRTLHGSRGHLTVSRMLALVTPVLPTCTYLMIGVVFMNDVRQI